MKSVLQMVPITFHEVYMDPDDHVRKKFGGRPPAGFNVPVGKDRFSNTVLFYYDRDGNFIAWARMMDPEIYLGSDDDLNKRCRPADRSLLSYDRRRIRALGFNHYTDWVQYTGSLPTLPDQVWLHHFLAGTEVPVWA